MEKTKLFFLICVSVILLFLLFCALGPFSKISVVELNVDRELKKVDSYIKKEEKILSHLNSYKGQFLWQVDLKDFVKEANDFYSGSEVYAVRKFPGRLIVFFRKKDTALLLLKDEGMFYSVSHEGDIGKKRELGESFDFPILRGKVFWLDSHLRKKTLSIFSSIPKTGRFFSAKNISEISYNKSNNSLIFYLLSGYFIVELKNGLHQKKIQNINFVLNYLNQKGYQKGYIDARLGKKIIVKYLN